MSRPYKQILGELLQAYRMLNQNSSVRVEAILNQRVRDLSAELEEHNRAREIADRLLGKRQEPHFVDGGILK